MCSKMMCKYLIRFQRIITNLMYLPILSTKTGKRMKKKNFHNRFLTIFKHLQCKTKLLNTSGLRASCSNAAELQVRPNFFVSSKKTSVLRQCIRPGTYQGQAMAAADPYPDHQPATGRGTQAEVARLQSFGSKSCSLR